MSVLAVKEIKKVNVWPFGVSKQSKIINTTYCSQFRQHQQSKLMGINSLQNQDSVKFSMVISENVFHSFSVVYFQYCNVLSLCDVHILGS